MIKKFGKLYKVLSESKDASGQRKNLGTATSKEAAEKRLKQVEYFKHKKKKLRGHYWTQEDDE
jgi:hypothetical protein